jgi:hypothetical protein
VEASQRALSPRWIHQPPRGNFSLLLPRAGDCISRGRALDPACFAPTSRQVGEKRACAGGSGGVEVTTLATDEARPTAIQVPSEVPPAHHRRVAIGKRLRRPPTSSKVAGKRKRSSSPSSSSSSIRSTEPDPRRTRFNLHKSIAYTTDSLP